jgi:WD40 repeat protein
MTSLFISYSRKDLESARKLTQPFEGQGLDFWIDWEGIPPTVDWWREIERGIEQADIFLFLLSPDSAGSKVCKQEIEHAAKNGKRLVPVVVRDIKADQAPTELKPLNWIFLRAADDYDAGLNKLIEAVKTDYEWVRAHRQLQVKALEWEKNNHGNGFLLHGEELQDAEVQLVANSSKEPHPTDLQREYILKSRQVTDRQRRRITSITIIGLIIVAALAVYGFVQAGIARTAQATAEANAAEAQTAQANAENRENARATAQAQAEERERIARAGELVAQSLSVRDTQLDLSSLLAVEAFDTWDYFRTRSVLADNLNTNPQLRQYMFKHRGWVSAVAFNPKTDTLASGGCSERVGLNCEEGEIVLWNLLNGKLNEVTSIQAHSSHAGSLAFNPEGTLLASEGCSQVDEGRCSEAEIILWSTENYQQVGEPLLGQVSEANNLAFSPDGRLLASGGCAAYELSACTQGEILLWDVERRTQLGVPIRAHTSWVTDLAFSPDGHLLASISGNGDILLWEVAQEQLTGPLLTFGTDYGVINHLEFSPDGKTLITDGVALWDVMSGQIMREFVGHQDTVYAVAFSPDGKLIATGGADKSIIVWDTESGRAINTFLGHSGIVTSVVFTSDGEYLASADEDGYVFLWSVADDVPLGDLIRNEPHGLMGASFQANGNIVTTEFRDGTVVISDLEKNAQIQITFEKGPDTVEALALSFDNQLLAVGGQEAIYLVDVETGTYLFDTPLTGHVGYINSLAFSPDKKILASGGCYNRQEDGFCKSGIIYLWNVQTGKRLGNPMIVHTNWVTGLAFSPDGKTLASGSTDDTILLLDLDTKEIVGIPFVGHTGQILGIAFSPDEKLLASGGSDGKIILWDMQTHQPIIMFDHLDFKQFSSNLIVSVAFNRNGDYLVSGDADGLIAVWVVDPNRWRDMTCQRIGRNLTRAEWALYFPNEEYSKTCQQWPLEPEQAGVPSPIP